MIGRGMRLYPGKVNCHIIDMVANLTTGIVTTPTLFGLDPSEVVNSSTVDDMRSIRELRKEELQRQHDTSSISTSGNQSPLNAPRNITFKDYDSVFDLIQDTSNERHVRALSMNNWTEVGENCFVLCSPTGAYIRLESVDKDMDRAIYIVRETMPTRPSKAQSISEGIAPFRTPREIARSEKFEDALHAADSYASKKYPLAFIRRNQPWRNGPATKGQLDFLNKLRLKDEPLTAETITKGRAGDMITKIKHGARGRFARVDTEKRKDERTKLKAVQDQVLRKREQVSVGPLL
jgi:ATP-dependent helicase IRC3